MTLDALIIQAPQPIENSSPPRVPSSGAPPHMKRPVLLPIVILAAALAAAGCVKPPAHPWVVRDGLIEVETYGRGLLFVKHDHHLGRYDDLLIENVGFRYYADQARLPDSDEDRIVAMLIGAIENSQDGVVGIANEAGPCVLSVNFYLKDLEFHSPDRDSNATTSFVSSYGEATMVLELRDSMNRDPLARFVQRRDLGGGRAVVRMGANLGRLDQTITTAIRDMGNQLRKVMPPTSGSLNTECHGAMATVALGRGRN